MVGEKLQFYNRTSFNDSLMSNHGDKNDNIKYERNAGNRAGNYCGTGWSGEYFSGNSLYYTN